MVTEGKSDPRRPLITWVNKGEFGQRLTVLSCDRSDEETGYPEAKQPPYTWADLN